MPLLPDIRWERFAQAVAAGATQGEAYRSSGFNSKHPDSAASKLVKHVEIKARIKELRCRMEKRATAAAVAKTAITKEVVLRQLWENHQAKPGTAVSNRVLELIGKELGMFGDQLPAAPPRLEDLSVEDLERMLGREPGSTAAAMEAEANGDQPPSAKPS